MILLENLFQQEKLFLKSENKMLSYSLYDKVHNFLWYLIVPLKYLLIKYDLRK